MWDQYIIFSIFLKFVKYMERETDIRFKNTLNKIPVTDFYSKVFLS